MKLTVSFITALFFYSSLFAQPGKGNTAPEIVLPNANGINTSLSSLRGKAVLVEFWASWCGPCRRNNPALHTLYNKYKSKGFEIFGISVDSEKDAWLQAVKEDKMNWMQVIDTEGNVANKWNVMYIPNSYLLDKNGKVIAINADEKKLDKLLKELLE